MGDQHAKLRSPITYMVLSYHLMAAGFQYAHEAVTDNGPAQVTYVHFLGEIRAGIIHDDGLRGRNRLYQWGLWLCIV